MIIGEERNLMRTLTHCKGKVIAQICTREPRIEAGFSDDQAEITSNGIANAPGASANDPLKGAKGGCYRYERTVCYS